MRSPQRAYRLGIDFDNTIVRYDELLYHEAHRRGLIPPQVRASKREIRDWIRRLPDGECEWQKLQAIVYGSKIHDAQPTPGLKEFFACCRGHTVQVFIVSHKTQYATLDEGKIDLRDAAMGWMRAHRFFDPEALELSPQDVYFESTRHDKIARIIQLRCTHFIDDLEETFLEPGFPKRVQKILYALPGPPRHLPGVRVASGWQDITQWLFNGTIEFRATP
ncbi:MAG: hypothetical protein HYZ89_07430 [Candidatus Omnitrophica bacterium]|nr:hypothetical protein [Candidatus Omnitrophota bacterium]